MNSLLTDYYLNKGKHPQKLLTELINLAQDMVDLSKVPILTIKPANDSISNQIIQLGNIYSGPLNSVGPLASPELSQALPGSSSHRSTSQNPAKSSGFGGVNDIVPQQTGNSALGGIFGGSSNDVNTLLLYNIAAMSY